MGVTRDLARLQSIGIALIRHGFGHHLSRVSAFKRLGLHSDISTPDSDVVQQLDAGQRFTRLLEELGPTFVKLGQILSTRPDLLPAHFVTALAQLQDQVPPLSSDIIRAAITQGLPGPIETHFSFLSEVPLASASIAQVHNAKLLDGTAVVVKVQRPGIGAQMEIDSGLIRKTAAVFELLFEEAGTYGPVAIVEEWQKGLALELDFENEARAIQAFYRANAKRENIRIPKLYPAHSSSTVLCMERLAGRHLNQIVEPEERQRVSHLLVNSAFEQVFEDGLFHADPHPGNFLILDDGSIGLLDFGLVGRISKNNQDQLIMLALAVAMGDADTMARLVYRIGASDERVQLSDLRSALVQMLDNFQELDLQELQSTALARQLLDVMSRFHLRVPREFALLAKAAVTMEGVIREFSTQFNIRSTLLPYTQELLLERFDPRQLQGGGFRLLLQGLGLIQDLPLQLTQTLADFETGRTSVRVQGRGLERVADSVRSLAAAVLSTGSALLLLAGGVVSAPYIDLRMMGWPISLLFGGVGAFAALALGSIFLLSGGRMPRLRLRKKGPKWQGYERRKHN